MKRGTFAAVSLLSVAFGALTLACTSPQDVGSPQMAETLPTTDIALVSRADAGTLTIPDVLAACTPGTVPGTGGQVAIAAGFWTGLCNVITRAYGKAGALPPDMATGYAICLEIETKRGKSPDEAATACTALAWGTYFLNKTGEVFACDAFYTFCMNQPYYHFKTACMSSYTTICLGK